ncbi:MAG: FAD:protein FMN transferase [Ruminococcaceae bacterium]|nr:FAD:protein FMN transferase [Oscillospiraceae bacterium]
MRKILTVSVVFFLICIFLSAVVSHYTSCHQTFFALDTNISIKAKGAFAKKAVTDCIEETHRIEKLFSAYIPSSEVFNLNKTGKMTASEETKKIISDAVSFSKKTYGAFDITIKPLADLWDIKNLSDKKDIPSDDEIKQELSKVGFENIHIYNNEITLKNNAKIDLGAIAKGYIADKAKDIMQKYNIKEAVLDFGGNIYVIGDKTYKIGLQNPNSERGEYFGIYEGKNISVVTSGAYERKTELDGKMYHHIISPFDGKCASSGITSVSIMGTSSTKCDAFATAVYVLGVEKGLEIVNNEPDIECVITDENNKVYFSDNVEFKITDESFK